MTDDTTREHHPVADLFPMLPDDELDDLAADIADRGLLQPVVLDADGRVLDGRNRLAACERAGVEPEFTVYDGDDPAGYALAVNITRRHLSTGARAVIVAQSARLNGVSLRSAAKAAAEGGDTDLYHPRIAEAAVVLEWAPDLVDGIVAGGPLSVAVAEARKRKQAAEREAAQTARLRREAPDLAELVADERMTLTEALDALRRRVERVESEWRAAATNLRSVLTYLTSDTVSPDELADDYAAVLDEFDPDDLAYAAETMTAIAKRGASA